MDNQANKLIKDYIKRVKEALPEWLKENKDELKSILEELEAHIRDKADGISMENRSQLESVRIAIDSMGTPESIAKEYKKRGTPQVYISKELWPIYKNIITIVFSVLVAIATFLTIFNALMGNFEDAFNFSGYALGFFASFSIISVIFVLLSMEGYFPEDFKSKAEIERKEREKEKAREMGMPISPKTGEPLKPFLNKIEKFVSGAISLVIGIILLIQPIPGFFSLMDPSFLTILRLLGLLILIDAFLTILRGVLDNDYISIHQGVQIIAILLKIAGISIFLVLLINPQIFPIIYWDGISFIAFSVPLEHYNTYKITLGVLTAIMGATIIENIYHIAKLEKYKV
ncbi:MAG: hypothetical protein GF317_16400 [Candidatus Lokiarchaeota archaeon]|nr:hypothetical protein [Candidatus Lokiarchaeota archaeon]MBD3201116.1 hypothetical protein [Candidatus Lokiarchaeota archaeon]